MAAKSPARKKRTTNPIRRRNAIRQRPEDGELRWIEDDDIRNKIVSTTVSVDVEAETSSKNKSPRIHQRPRHGSASTVDHPTEDVQFEMTAECKYYGCAVTDWNAATSQPGQYTQMIRTAMENNKRQHVRTIMRVTDQGFSVNDKMANDLMFHLQADNITAVVPGTLKSKSGKRFTVAVIVEKDSANNLANRPCHVFQLEHPDDGAQLREAADRMWEDHMFRVNFGATTEAEQAIDFGEQLAQDILHADRRRSEILLRMSTGDAEQITTFGFSRSLSPLSDVEDNLVA